MDTPADRLQWARSQKYPTIKAAAEAFGWHKQNVADHEAGRRKISAEQAKSYARALNVPANWLLFGGIKFADTSVNDVSSMIPLAGFVSAGAEAVFIDQSETQSAPEFIQLKLKGRLAMRVQGESMSPRFLPGERLIFGPEQSPESLINREVMAQISNGPLVVKLLRRGSVAGQWMLQSYNPAHEPIENAVLDWARPFEGMMK